MNFFSPSETLDIVASVIVAWGAPVLGWGSCCDCDCCGALGWSCAKSIMPGIRNSETDIVVMARVIIGVNVDGCCSARQLTASSILFGSEIVASSTLGDGGRVYSHNARSVLFHVRKHLGPASSEKSDEKKRCNGQENNIQNGGVIEADRHLDDLSTALRGNQPQ